MKRKLKGMTLVEVLVAMAVFSIISALLASACAGVISIVRKTDKLNKKISNEAPLAEQRREGTTLGTDTMVIKIEDTTYPVLIQEYVVTDPSENYEEGGNFKYFDVPAGEGS